MRNFLKAVILIPLALLIVAFAVANRQIVAFTLDPFGLAGAPLNFQAPLFALAFALVIVGVVIGGIATWLKQSHWRRAARTLDADNRKLRADNDQLRRRVDMAEAAIVARTDQPKLMRPPAA
jgi:uncharacterized integral membrane protein